LDDNQNIDNDSQYLDEMIQDVPSEFVKILEIFENVNESNVPLFPGCTKFTKITAIFINFSYKFYFILVVIYFISMLIFISCLFYFFTLF
jgi:hypothetical protein